MASALNIQGISFVLRGNGVKAIDLYTRSLSIREDIGDKNGVAGSLNNIGAVYNYQEDHSKALEYYTRSLVIEEEAGNKKGIASSLNNIGIIHMEQGDHALAIDFYTRGLKITEEIGDKFGAATSLSIIGESYLQQGQLSKSMDHFSQSLNIREEIGDTRGMATSLYSLGVIYLELGDYDKALDHCSRSLVLAEEIQVIAQQREACFCLYKTFKITGKGIQALEYHEKVLAFDDSLNVEETATKLQQMEFAKQILADSIRQQEEKLKIEMAHQLEVSRKEKSRNVFMAGGALLLLLAIGLYSRMLFVRKAKDRMEKEKDRSDNLLLNILPKEIAEELKEKGEAAARDFDVVSILFTDFKGFTQTSEKLSATDLVAEINVCFKAFDGIVGKYNIEKIKTIGDAYMCAGGLPVPDENAVSNTVKAGLEMQAFMIARKTERDVAGLPAFEMRLGIHTGPVVAGIVGVKKFQYDIWGDTVNTASRMESSSEVGQVNISEATYKLVKNNLEFGFTSRGKIEAKGKGELEMYFVNHSFSEG